MTLRDTAAPSGPIASRWERRQAELALVGPTRRRQHHVLVVGAGLAGASAAATLSELGHRVRCLTFHDSPRRAHSVAAQGGINAAKNYGNDGDSVERLFHDTLEGGDFRSRESNVLAALREAFWEDVMVPGDGHELNQELERAGRVADFLELGELMCRDALAREESCGCHFRVEHQTEDGEARRDDTAFAHVAAWVPGAPGRGPERLVEPLAFETLAPSERSYR